MIKRKKVVVEVTVMLPEAEVDEMEKMRKANYAKGVTLGHVAGTRVSQPNRERIAEGISNWLYGRGVIGN